MVNAQLNLADPSVFVTMERNGMQMSLTVYQHQTHAYPVQAQVQPIKLQHVQLQHVQVQYA